MAASATEDAWMEVCLISIAPIGGSDIQFAALTETIDIDQGDKDIEGIPIVNGGRVVKWNPEADTTITLEAYPLEAGTDSGTTGLGFFGMMHTEDASEPIRIVNDHKRTKHRVLILWTNDATATTAQSVTAENASALRVGFAEAYVTKVTESFTDGILKFTITIKCAPYDKAAVANLLMESAAGLNGADLLPAIAGYTSTYKFFVPS